MDDDDNNNNITTTCRDIGATDYNNIYLRVCRYNIL